MERKHFKQRVKDQIGEHPDLFFIITDQERATQYFPENWEENNLRTLTFLKQKGFTFNQAFCNSCMCSPSRSTLLTGTYPSQHRVTQTLTEGGVYSPGEITLNPQTPNIARILDTQGRQIKTLTFYSNEIVSFGNELRSGLYLVEVIEGDNVKMMKVVKY
jgi:hypothetical protein